jgi:hypothetical protein
LAYPYRVHIGLLAVGSVAIALICGNRASRFLAGCALLALLFFAVVTNANKSPRYLSLLMPFVVLLWAQGIWFVWDGQFRATGILPLWARARASKITAAGLFMLVGLSQLAGNMIYLWQARPADVCAVCHDIDTLIPRESTVYGGMAFWIGLRNHVYVPYQRMPWQQAIDEYHPNIVILNDRVMVHGSYPGEWDSLRAELSEYVAVHGRLLGEVPNGFYGEGGLKVFEVSFDR